METNHYDLTYLKGFGNEFESEAPGYEGKAIPKDYINPQIHPLGLYTEQISGTAFTAPRGLNKRSWLYRILPSVCHKPFVESAKDLRGWLRTGFIDPNQRRWFPFRHTRWGEISTTSTPIDFIEGIQPLCKSPNIISSGGQASLAIHIYLANINMIDKCMQNSDGDFLIVPQLGSLLVQTEFGYMLVEPEEICVIQAGMKFTITSPDLKDVVDSSKFIRGYILEVIGCHFELPTLGLIGANCLANPKDFQIPTANLQHSNAEYTIVKKFQHSLYEAKQDHSPYDVVGWFGNYTPYKYDCRKFVAVNTVTKDHPDPSIFTVLTCPMPGRPGTALADFVIFPPRWEAASHTFRPPYFHRNIMTEFMGLIKGQYQAKSNKFGPGGATLHPSMSAHGPDKSCFDLGTSQSAEHPTRVADDSLAFMFETSLTLGLTDYAHTHTDKNYFQCWQSFQPNFNK